MISPLGLRLARLRARLWRFRTLHFAQRLFAGAPSSTVLDRPFFGYRLFLDVSRSDAQRLLYLEGERFLAERSLLDRLARPGFQVVDVGANIGYYMLYLARRVGATGAVCCLEPEPENFVELARNVERNGLTNVRALPVAAGAADGEASLLPGINGVIESERESAGSLTVPLRSLDSLLPGPVDLLKIDVEGYEGHVLAGAAGLLARCRPALFVEIHPALLAPGPSIAEILARLTALYPRIAAYRPLDPNRRGSRWNRLAARYWGSSIERIADLDGHLARCRDGMETDPFWIVCRCAS